MSFPTPKTVARRFQAAINDANLDALVALMTDDHRFVDSAGSVVDGREGCERAWAGFFSAFPHYRNVVEVTVADGDTVAMRGYSVAREPVLRGPAIWVARIRGTRVAEWRVHEDDAALREALGLG